MLNAINLPTNVFYSFINDREKIINYIHNLIKNAIDSDKTLSDEQKTRYKKTNDCMREVFFSIEIVHLIKLPMGFGKTATFVRWMVYFYIYFLKYKSTELDGIVIMNREYKNGVNVVEGEINKFFQDFHDIVRFEGKSRLCKVLDKKINKNGFTIRDGLKSGLPITYICDSGEYCDKDDCDFYKNKKLLEKYRFMNTVIHQIDKFFPFFLGRTHNTILIIDEDFEDAIKVPRTIYKKTLQDNIMLLKMIDEKIDKKEKKRDTEVLFKYDIKNITNLLVFLKQYLDGSVDINNDNDLSKMKQLLDVDNVGELVFNSSIIKNIEKKGWDLFKTSKKPPFKIFLFYTLKLFIENYYNQEDTNPNGLDKWIRAVFFKKQTKTKSWCLSTLFYNNNFNKLLYTDKITKLIFISATISKEKLEHYINPDFPIVEHKIEYEYKNIIRHRLAIIKRGYRANKTTPFAQYPKSSFCSMSTFNILMADLRSTFEFCRDKNIKPLVLMREIKSNQIIDKKTGKKFSSISNNLSLSDYIKELTKKTHSLEPYIGEYPLTGTNDFVDARAVIVLMKPQLPKPSNERQANLLSIEPDLYSKNYAEENITQGIGRVLRTDEKVYVFEFPFVNLPFLQNTPAITFTSHKRFREHLKKVIEEEHENKQIAQNYKKITTFIKQHNSININQCVNLLGKSYYLAKKVLNDLVESNVLKCKKTKIGNYRPVEFYKFK